jgi:hypothetical protein
MKNDQDIPIKNISLMLHKDSNRIFRLIWLLLLKQWEELTFGAQRPRRR